MRDSAAAAPRRPKREAAIVPPTAGRLARRHEHGVGRTCRGRLRARHGGSGGGGGQRARGTLLQSRPLAPPREQRHLLRLLFLRLHFFFRMAACDVLSPCVMPGGLAPSALSGRAPSCTPWTRARRCTRMGTRGSGTEDSGASQLVASVQPQSAADASPAAVLMVRAPLMVRLPRTASSSQSLNVWRPWCCGHPRMKRAKCPPARK